MKKYLIIAIAGLLLSVTSEAYALEITPGGCSRLSPQKLPPLST